MTIDLSIFAKPDPSGSFYKEKFLLKNYPEILNFINDFSISNNINDLPFKEKVYLSINGINSRPLCKNPNCSNEVKFKNSNVGYLQYCSNKCISSDPKIKNKKEQSSLIKFGTKTPSESIEIKEKIIQTNIIKYGGNSPQSSLEIRDKVKKTIMDRYGVENLSFHLPFIEKRVNTFKDNIDNYKKSYESTSIERYGTKHPWMNKTIHDKTIEFFYRDYRNRIIEKIDGLNLEFISFQKNITTTLKFKCKECNSEFDILTYQFYYRSEKNISICTNCFPISNSTSILQSSIYEFIKSNYKGTIIENDKISIHPSEIDIYLPELNIGFEINGVYWHSEKFKDPNYHLIKQNKSSVVNINLYTIWEDDWFIKNDIIKSFILNKLNGAKKRIYARKCIIKEISYSDSRKFLDNNHLQGDIKSPIRIGLYYEDTLVSLMTFGYQRLVLSQQKEDSIYELTRFANENYSSVIGGASKILSFFIKKYNPLNIITYSDNLISNGSIYQILGFKFKGESKPGYWYNIDGIRSHRYNWRKHKLVKMGFDLNKTEEEIMNELGYYRVYNGGNKRWELNRKTNTQDI